ncbi:MAG: FkbM family methyltransferase, partial [Candidatus Omnitrophota bacterium]
MAPFETGWNEQEIKFAKEPRPEYVTVDDDQDKDSGGQMPPRAFFATKSVSLPRDFPPAQQISIGPIVSYAISHIEQEQAGNGSSTIDENLTKSASSVMTSVKQKVQGFVIQQLNKLTDAGFIRPYWIEKEEISSEIWMQFIVGAACGLVFGGVYLFATNGEVLKLLIFALGGFACGFLTGVVHLVGHGIPAVFFYFLNSFNKNFSKDSLQHKRQRLTVLLFAPALHFFSALASFAIATFLFYTANAYVEIFLIIFGFFNFGECLNNLGYTDGPAADGIRATIQRDLSVKPLGSFDQEDRSPTSSPTRNYLRCFVPPIFLPFEGNDAQGASSSMDVISAWDKTQQERMDDIKSAIKSIKDIQKKVFFEHQESAAFWNKIDTLDIWNDPSGFIENTFDYIPSSLSEEHLELRRSFSQIMHAERTLAIFFDCAVDDVRQQMYQQSYGKHMLYFPHSFVQKMIKKSSSNLQLMLSRPMMPVPEIKTIKDLEQRMRLLPCDYKVILVNEKGVVSRSAQEALEAAQAEGVIKGFIVIDDAAQAFALIHNGTYHMVMKGSMLTASLMKTALASRKSSVKNVISLVALLDAPQRYPYPILFSDPGITTKTNDVKVVLQLVKNACEVSYLLGINPRVALLSAIEHPTSAIPFTLVARAVQDFFAESKLSVAGPLSFDLALFPQSLKAKGFSEDHPVAGKANVLISSVEVLNVFYKVEVENPFQKDAPQLASVVWGAECPMIVTSRSDSAQTKRNSIVLATYLSALKKNSLMQESLYEGPVNNEALSSSLTTSLPARLRSSLSAACKTTVKRIVNVVFFIVFLGNREKRATAMMRFRNFCVFLTIAMAWGKKDGLYYKEVFGHPFYIRPRVASDLSEYRLISHYYGVIDNVVSPQFIVDCGAYIGATAIYYLNTYPQVHVVALESDPQTFAVLEKNLAPYRDRVRLINKAIWPRDANLVVVRKENNQWGNFVREAQAGEEPEIFTTTIQDVLRQSSFSKMDVLKMNVEGAERFVFADHQEDWLPKTKNIVIDLHDRIWPGCSDAVFTALKEYAYQLTMKGHIAICQDIIKTSSSCLWEEFRQIDHKLKTEVEELLWLRQAHRQIGGVKRFFEKYILVGDGVQTTEQENGEIKERIISVVEEGKTHAKLENARHATKQKIRESLDEILNLIGTEDQQLFAAMLGQALTLIETRGLEVRKIVKNIYDRQLPQLKTCAEYKNNQYLGRVDRILQDLESGEAQEAWQHIQGFLNSQDLRSYFSEPDFLGLRQLLGYAGALVKEKNKAAAKARLQLFKESIEAAQTVHSFMQRVRVCYVQGALNGPGLSWQQAFDSVYSEFLTEKGITRGSPQEDVFRLAVSRAAFIPFKIDHPQDKTKRIDNPLFLAVTAFMSIQRSESFSFVWGQLKKKAPATAALLLSTFQESEKINFVTLNVRDRKNLIAAMAQDYQLKQEDVRVFVEIVIPQSRHEQNLLKAIKPIVGALEAKSTRFDLSYYPSYFQNKIKEILRVSQEGKLSQGALAEKVINLFMEMILDQYVAEYDENLLIAFTDFLAGGEMNQGKAWILYVASLLAQQYQLTAGQKELFTMAVLLSTLEKQEKTPGASSGLSTQKFFSISLLSIIGFGYEQKTLVLLGQEIRQIIDLAQKNAGPFIVLLAGPTGTLKTTFAKMIADKAEHFGLSVALVDEASCFYSPSELSLSSLAHSFSDKNIILVETVTFLPSGHQHLDLFIRFDGSLEKRQERIVQGSQSLEYAKERTAVISISNGEYKNYRLADLYINTDFISFDFLRNRHLHALFDQGFSLPVTHKKREPKSGWQEYYYVSFIGPVGLWIKLGQLIYSSARKIFTASEKKNDDAQKESLSVVSSAVTKKVWVFVGLGAAILLANIITPNLLVFIYSFGFSVLMLGFWAVNNFKNKKIKDLSVSALLHNGAQDPYDLEFISRSLSELQQYVSVKKRRMYVGRCVAIFGGAQVVTGSPDYEDAVALAKMIKCPVVTGGGPGIMEAANKGARESSKSWSKIKKSIGLTISLPNEQKANPYLDIELHFQKDLFSRKMTFFQFCKAYVVCPGGFGTLDELFDVLALVDRGFLKTHIFIFNSNGFYTPLLELLDALEAKGYLTKSLEELSCYVHVCDTLEEIGKQINALPAHIRTLQMNFSDIKDEFQETKEKLTQISKAVGILGGGVAVGNNYRYQRTIRDLCFYFASEGVSVMARSAQRIGRLVDDGVEKAMRHALSGAETGKFINLKTKTQLGNPDPDIMVEYSHMFMQKVGFIKYSSAYIFFPGGFGTLSLLFEVITLIKTFKVPALPIILVGRRFWQPWHQFIVDTLLAHKLISKEGPQLYTVMSADPQRIISAINQFYLYKSQGAFFPQRPEALARQDPNLMKLINFLKPAQGLSGEELEKYLYADGAKRCQRKVAWVKNNPDIVKRKSSESLKDWMMRVYVEENLGIDSKQIRVSEATETKVVFDYFNRCLTLEACQMLGLDTRKVCRCGFDKCYDVLFKAIDPRLSFKRVYVYDDEGNITGGVRPYAEFCREIITYDPTQSTGCSSVTQAEQKSINIINTVLWKNPRMNDQEFLIVVKPLDPDLAVWVEIKDDMGSEISCVSLSLKDHLVTNLNTKPEYQHRGFGTKAVMVIFEEASRHGILRLGWHIMASNERSIKTFEAALAESGYEKKYEFFLSDREARERFNTKEKVLDIRAQRKSMSSPLIQGQAANDLLLPGAQDAIKFGDQKLIEQYEKDQRPLAAPMGLEVEFRYDTVTYFGDFNARKMIQALPCQPHFIGKNLLEFSLNPSESYQTQLYLVRELMKAINVLKEDILSVQINMGVPSLIWQEIPEQAFIKEARMLMFAVVMGFVSDRRIENKQTSKVATIRDGRRETMPLRCAKYIRVEYGFADIDELETIANILQYLHTALLHFYRSEQGIFLSSYERSLADVWGDKGHGDLNLLVQAFLLLASKEIRLNKAKTFKHILSWRQKQPEIFQEMTDVLIKAAEECKNMTVPVSSSVCKDNPYRVASPIFLPSFASAFSTVKFLERDTPMVFLSSSSAILRGISEQGGFVVLDIVQHNVRTVLKIAKDLLTMIEIGRRGNCIVPTEAKLLILEDILIRQQEIFDIFDYLERVESLSEMDRWWQEGSTKEISLSFLTRDRSTALFDLFKLYRYLEEEKISWSDFSAEHPIEVLELSDGSYFILQGADTADLGVLLGFEKVQARILKIKSMDDHPYGRVVRKRAAEHLYSLNDQFNLNDVVARFESYLRELFFFPEEYPQHAFYQVLKGGKEFSREYVMTFSLPSCVNALDQQEGNAYVYLAAFIAFFDYSSDPDWIASTLSQAVEHNIFRIVSFSLSSPLIVGGKVFFLSAAYNKLTSDHTFVGRLKTLDEYIGVLRKRFDHITMVADFGVGDKNYSNNRVQSPTFFELRDTLPRDVQLVGFDYNQDIVDRVQACIKEKELFKNTKMIRGGFETPAILYPKRIDIIRLQNVWRHYSLKERVGQRKLLAKSLKPEGFLLGGNGPIFIVYQKIKRMLVPRELNIIVDLLPDLSDCEELELMLQPVDIDLEDNRRLYLDLATMNFDYSFGPLPAREKVRQLGEFLAERHYEVVDHGISAVSLKLNAQGQFTSPAENARRAKNSSSIKVFDVSDMQRLMEQYGDKIETLLRNTVLLQLTLGCSQQCWFCSRSAGKLQALWSEEAAYYLEDRYGEFLKILVLFGSNEPFDHYAYERVLKYVEQRQGTRLVTSTSFPQGAEKRIIDFIKEGSHVVISVKDGNVNRLIEHGLLHSVGDELWEGGSFALYCAARLLSFSSRLTDKSLYSGVLGVKNIVYRLGNAKKMKNLKAMPICLLQGVVLSPGPDFFMNQIAVRQPCAKNDFSPVLKIKIVPDQLNDPIKPGMTLEEVLARSIIERSEVSERTVRVFNNNRWLVITLPTDEIALDTKIKKISFLSSPLGSSHDSMLGSAGKLAFLNVELERTAKENFFELLRRYFGAGQKVSLLDMGSGANVWPDQLIRRREARELFERIEGIDQKMYDMVMRHRDPELGFWAEITGKRP